VRLAVRRLDDAATIPTRAHEGDAGLDLYSCEAVSVPAAGRTSVGTGIAIEVPPGHAALVLPRSGLAARHGIALVNAPGLIDAGYRGEVRVLLHNTDRADDFPVAPGDRIAQLLVIPFAAADPVEVEELSASRRGEGGFGSSGR
jgi:dUTP pyrophosphatase